MKQAGITSLTRSGGPQVRLVDDGTGLDAHKDDGVYTGAFTATPYEGSYTFRFRARGKNSSDNVFDRTETQSVYVRFNPSPEATRVETVRQLTDEERVEELASMLGAATKVTRRSAQELLERVGRVKGNWGRLSPE